MKTRHWVTILAAAGLLAATAGCAALVVGSAAAAGAGGYAYLHGELRSTEAAPLDRAWSATLAALKDLEFPVTKQKKDALEGALTARTANDKKIQVGLRKVSEVTTEIRIRVGTFGDETLSRALLEKIKKRL